MTTTPSLYESLGLSVNYAPPIYQSPPLGGMGRITEELSDLSMEKAVEGGYLSAAFSISGPLVDLEDWFVYGLGRDVTMLNPALETCWNGFVNQIAINAGSLAVTRGPLASGVVNRTFATYSLRITTVNPPVVIPGCITTIAQDTDSQARWGIWQAQLDVGETTDTDADQARDTFLQDRKEPETSEQISIGGGSSEAKVSVECLGYGAWLAAYPYTETGGATITVTTKILSVLANDPNNIISADYSYVGTNPLLAPQYENSNTSAWDMIKSLAALGDAGNNRWLFGIYNDQRAYYEQMPSTPTYQHRITGRDQGIQKYGTGIIVDPWDIKPGKWLFLPDFLVGRTQPATDMRFDPRYMFIESVSYSAPDSLSLSGARVGKLAQLLAQKGLGGMGG